MGPYGYDIGSDPISIKLFQGFIEKFSIEKLIKFKNHLLCISGKSVKIRINLKKRPTQNKLSNFN